MITTGQSATLEAAAEELGEIDLGPLPQLVGYVARRAQLAIFDDFNRTLSQLDLRPGEFGVLLVVSRNPGLRQRRVGGALGIQPPNMAVLAARLAARGLLEQHTHPEDKRAVALHLTDAGCELLQKAEQLVTEHDRRVSGSLTSAEREQLRQLLGKLG